MPPDDRAFAAVDRHLRALDAAFAPSRSRLDRIREEVLRSTSSIPAEDRPVLRLVAPPNGVVAPPLSRWPLQPDRWSFAHLSSVALLLIALVSSIGALWLAKPRPVNLGLGGEHSTVVTVIGDEVSPEECRVEPRPLRFFAPFVGTPDDDRAPVMLDALSDLIVDDRLTVELDEPVDAATLAAINATMRERTACSNGGDYLRGSALSTNSYLRRQYTLAPMSPADFAFLSEDPVPLPKEHWNLYFALAYAWWLSDGRVLAVASDDLVRLVGPTPEPDTPYRTGVLALRHFQGRWRVDDIDASTLSFSELRANSASEPNTAATPSPVPEVVPPAECRVEPRPLSFFAAATPTSAVAAAEPIQWVGFLIDDDRLTVELGEPVDAETLAAINATGREARACSNANDLLRLSALYTDETMGRYATSDPVRGSEEFGHLAASPSPAPIEEWRTFIPFTHAWWLADGRVLGISDYGPRASVLYDETRTHVYAFRRVGQRWLIDDLDRTHLVPADLLAMTATRPIASPAPYPESPSPAECTVAPRPVSFFAPFVGAPAPGGDPRKPIDQVSDLIVNDRLTVELGEPVGPETLAAINATMREAVACGNANDRLRGFALFTDDFLRRLAESSLLTPEELAAFAASPTPAPIEDWELFAPFAQAWRLDDGRVLAMKGRDPARYVSPSAAVAEPYGTFVVVVRRVGPRWLIDDIDGSARTPDVVLRNTTAPPTGSPVPTGARPHPGECTAAPRPPSFFAEAALTPVPQGDIGVIAVGPSEVVLGSYDGRILTVLRIGGAVSAEDQSAIQEMLHQLGACHNANDHSRLFALYTDELARSESVSVVALDALETPPTPLDEDEWVTYLPADMRWLSDGRVVVLIDLAGLTDEASREVSNVEGRAIALLLARVGDQWRLDETSMREFPADALAPAPEVQSGDPGAIKISASADLRLEVVVDDVSVFRGDLPAGESTDWFVGRQVVVFTSDGINTYLTNEDGVEFQMSFDAGPATFDLFLDD